MCEDRTKTPPLLLPSPVRERDKKTIYPHTVYSQLIGWWDCSREGGKLFVVYHGCRGKIAVWRREREMLTKYQENPGGNYIVLTTKKSVV